MHGPVHFLALLCAIFLHPTHGFPMTLQPNPMGFLWLCNPKLTGFLWPCNPNPVGFPVTLQPQTPWVSYDLASLTPWVSYDLATPSPRGSCIFTPKTMDPNPQYVPTNTHGYPTNHDFVHVTKREDGAWSQHSGLNTCVKYGHIVSPYINFFVYDLNEI